jgi:RimJ/RimL family protein N-acetyltransferase
MESTVRSRSVPPLRIEWADLSAIEPSPDDVARFADALSIAYNEPRNASLLGHTQLMSPADVIEHYADMADEGAHQFLLLRDGNLSGDGDLRGISADAAEFAFLIADPGAQGKGLGTRFATMLCTAGFANLGLEHIYASIVPENIASRRVFEKLGYVLDDSSTARDFAEDKNDIVMSIDRATFLRVNAAAIAHIVVRC